MMDAAQLADELRSEQEHARVLEKERREQEARAKDLQVQLKCDAFYLIIICK